ncbi:MAG: hypothetical protein WD512_14950, partial [Candidatus Paceibacterota bacterium]
KNNNKSLDEISAVIVATKSDLIENRQITDQDLHQISTKYQIPYFVVSCIYDHDKIVRLFHVLSNLILDKYITNTTFKEEDLDKFRIERDTPTKRLKWCC